MKSFEKKSSLSKTREAALKKNLKKRRKFKTLKEKEKCQFCQTNGLNKQPKQMV
jgi:hypothetical protein